jgi:hypothetical protein
MKLSALSETLPPDKAVSTLINMPDGVKSAENDQLCRTWRTVAMILKENKIK